MSNLLNIFFAYDPETQDKPKVHGRQNKNHGTKYKHKKKLVKQARRRNRVR